MTKVPEIEQYGLNGRSLYIFGGQTKGLIAETAYLIKKNKGLITGK